MGEEGKQGKDGSKVCWGKFCATHDFMDMFCMTLIKLMCVFAGR